MFWACRVPLVLCQDLRKEPGFWLLLMWLLFFRACLGLSVPPASIYHFLKTHHLLLFLCVWDVRGCVCACAPQDSFWELSFHFVGRVSLDTATWWCTTSWLMTHSQASLSFWSMGHHIQLSVWFLGVELKLAVFSQQALFCWPTLLAPVYCLFRNVLTNSALVEAVDNPRVSFSVLF